jgi:hypothetical protein
MKEGLSKGDIALYSSSVEGCSALGISYLNLITFGKAINIRVGRRITSTVAQSRLAWQAKALFFFSCLRHILLERLA